MFHESSLSNHYLNVLIWKQPLEVFCPRGVIGDFAGFVGRRLFWGLHFNRVAGLRSVTLFIGRLRREYFPVGFVRSEHLWTTASVNSSLISFSHSIVFLLIISYTK